MEMAAFSSSVKLTSVVLNSTLHPISEENEGGNFNLTEFQLVLYRFSKSVETSSFF